MIPNDVQGVQRLDHIITWILDHPDAVAEEAERRAQEAREEVAREARRRAEEEARREEMNRNQQQQSQTTAAQEFLSSFGVSYIVLLIIYFSIYF